MRKHLFTLLTALLMLCDMSGNAQKDTWPYSAGESTLRIGSKEYTIADSCIKYRDTTSNKWRKLYTHTEYLRDLWCQDNENIYLSDINLNKYRLNLKDHNIYDLSLEKSVRVPNLDVEVEAIKFEMRKHGCMYYASAKRIYKKEGTDFLLKEDTATANFGQEMQNMPTQLSSADVDKLIQYISNSMKEKYQPWDLTFSDADKQHYKMWLLCGHPLHMASYFSNIDKDYYLNTTPIGQLDSTQMRNMFARKTENLTFTLGTTEITFRLSNGTYLTLQNREGEPNYMLTPWIAYYKGEPFLLKDVAVGQEIDRLTEGKFIANPFNTKDYAIFNILRHLNTEQKGK